MGDASKIKELSLGKKIKQIRIEKKITQQELVGDFITRNMLSQIENDIATPSIKTLQFLADSLEVPLSFLMVGEHDDEYNKNFEFDDIDTIKNKARNTFFVGEYLKYIEITDNNPEMVDDKEVAMLLGLSCLEAASESFLKNDTDKCLEYCKKAEGCVFTLGGLAAGKPIRRQAELYRFLCQPILTDDGEENTSPKLSNLTSDNFIIKTYDENGICRHNIIAAHRALKRNEPQEALKYLRESEIYADNFARHPYKKELYKLFEMAYVKIEDYKNAHLYTTKLLSLYSEQVKK
jgi:transcriptional regulator with XRE-family HTH domain